jgi:uncharacterized Zn finger protein (UPF0148 family)
MQTQDVRPKSDTAYACPKCGQKLVDSAGLGWCAACGFCRALTESDARLLGDAPQTPTSATEAAPVLAEPAPVSDVCPKCSAKLVDSNGLGWCAACGYCRTLTESNINLEPTRPRTIRKTLPSLGGLVETTQAVGQLPSWFWMLLFVIAQGTVLSLIAGRDLPPGDNFVRALWTTAQLGLGVLLVLIAQCWLLMHIAPEDPTLSYKDAVIPFRIWALAFRRLPKCRISLWIAAFGVTLVVGAIAFIGGLEHWLGYLHAPNAPPPPPPAAPAQLFVD